MKRLNVILLCLFSINFSCYSAQVKQELNFFETMNDYSADCTKCLLHKILINMINNLASCCGKNEEFIEKFNIELSKIDAENFTLNLLCDLEIKSVFDLAKEVSVILKINDGEIIFQETLAILKKLFNNNDNDVMDKNLKQLLHSTMFSLADICNRRYECCEVIIPNKNSHLKNNSTHLLFKKLNDFSIDVAGIKNQNPGYVLFHELIAQIDKLNIQKQNQICIIQ